MLANLIVGLLAIGLAALVLIYGFKLFKIFLPILGLVVGLFLGAGLVTIIFGHGLFATVLSWAVAIAFGILFGLFAYFLYTIFIILLGASLGAGLFAWVFTILGFNPGLFLTFVTVVGAVLFGILSAVLRLQKYLIILWTSFAGASTAIFGFLLVFNRIELDHLPSGEALDYFIANSFFWMIIWIIIASAGIIVQAFKNEGKELEKKTTRGAF
jgi:hypothetical protein